MSNICWFQILKCDNVLLFSVFCHHKLNIVGIWAVGQDYALGACNLIN